MSPSEVVGNTGWLSLCEAIVSSGATVLTDRVNPKNGNNIGYTKQNQKRRARVQDKAEVKL